MLYACGFGSIQRIFLSGGHCYCPVWLWVLEPCRGGCTTFMAGLLDPDTEVAEPPYLG